MKWFLIWLIVTTGPNGEIESRMYSTQISSEQACYAAQANMDTYLLQKGYTNFTTACEAQ